MNKYTYSMTTALCGLLLSGSTSSAARRRDPTGPNHDLTREIDFERMSTFHLGQTGAHGWMYVKKQMTKDARQILITKVDEGLPADGVLKEGDVILGVGGRRFASDARKCLGLAIDEAEREENRGILRLTRWRPIKDANPRRGKEEEVQLKLKVMGSFSDTAPYDCPKSRRIMAEALKHVTAKAARKDFGRLGEGALALMAVGEPEHMQMVREYLHEAKWAKPDFRISLKSGGLVCWGLGLHNLIMTEYYLAAGDRYVLPAIREHAVKMAMGQSGGGLWGHGFAWTSQNDGKLHGRLGGYGALNLAGLPCLLSMVLAKRCGIEHPEIDMAIGRSLRFFSDFVGRGTIGYGYHRPSLDHYNCGRNGFSSNGKNSIAGIIFTLLGNRKVSNYFSTLVTSSYDEREYGHAGNSFNVFWGMMGANCGGPEAVSAFHREMRWYNAMTRKTDGSFIFQQLGGYYGGVTMNLEAAHVIANALPLRKLYVTGKDPDEKLWLTDTQVEGAIDAGRWHWADYDEISGERLIEELDCWSPGAREWIAEALGRKEGDFVTPLLKAIKSDSGHKRAGACTALGYQRDRAAPAVPALVGALSDEDSTVRVAASYALMRVGKPARKAIPDMLRAVVTTEQEGPLHPTMQALSFSLGSDGARTAPLYFTGIFASTPEGENPLDGMDREILYPAIARLAKSRSGRIRGCGVYVFKYFSKEDVKMMAQEIYDVTKTKAPDFVMFSERPRCHGMDLMARHQITDGLELCIDSLLGRSWGAGWREPHHFLTLQTYGRLARSVLPRLKEARWTRRSGEKRAVLEETIRIIETDQREVKPISLMDLVAERVEEQMATTRGKRAQVKLCRRLIEDEPEDYFQQAVALRQLVSILKTGAFDDILSALASPSEILQAEAVRLGSGLPGSRISRKWKKALRKAEPRRLAGILKALAQRGDPDVLPETAVYLESEHESVRVAAIECAAALGGGMDIPGLIKMLDRELTQKERAAVTSAIAALCRKADDRGRGPGLVVAAIPGAGQAARDSLVRTLGRIGGAGSLEAVIALIGDKNRTTRRAAADALAASEDPAITGRLLAAAKKTEDRRRRSEIAQVCLRRVITGRVPAKEKLPSLRRIMDLAGGDSVAVSALTELEWMPSPDALHLARSWMEKKGEGKKTAAIIEAAARAVVGVSRAMDMSDPKQKTQAVKAVKEALQLTKDEATIKAADEFIGKHGE